MTQPAKRFPFLMWGDLVENHRPILRRALAGYRAHECMYAWVYLTEFLAHRRLLERLPSLPEESRLDFIRQIDAGLWSHLDRSTVDPHFQVSKSMFEPVAAMACLAAGSGEREPEFVELGSTFFTSITRFALVDKIARERFADWPALQPRWVGIDNSPFMHDATRALHGDGAITLVGDHRAVAKLHRFAVFLSRFVASYAFTGGGEYAAYLADRFQAALIEDAYATTAEQLQVFNHGQAETFFSIPEVFARLEQSGFEIFLLDSYPDYPSGAAPCHVVRYLAARKGLVNEVYGNRMRDLGFDLPRAPVAAGSILQRLNDAVSPALWKAVRKAKAESPVWGRTPVASTAKGLVPGLRAAGRFLRQRLMLRPWSRYQLDGPLALREIYRAVREERP